VTLLGLALLGCPGEELPRPETLADCSTTVAQEQKAAAAAAKAMDEDAAARAARRAEAIAARAEELLAAQRGAAGEAPSAEASAGLQETEATVREVSALARATRRDANLTEERVELRDRTTGLTAQGYDKARTLALTGVFKALALAARQAETRGTDGLPEQAQASLRSAVWIVNQLDPGGQAVDPHQPDYGVLAASLDGHAGDPPPRLHEVLALGLLLLGRDGFALQEVQAVDFERIPLAEERAAVRVLRAVIYRVNGLPTLAALELERCAGEDEVGQLAAAYGPDMVAGLHVLLAAYYLEQKELERADAQIALAVRTAPNHPLTVYVTGERLAAEGSWEEAAASLEKSAVGTEDEWLAKKIADRAREVRDAEGTTPPLLADSKFLLGVCLHLIRQAARESEAAAKLQATVDGAKDFCGRLLGRLDGGGDADVALPEGEGDEPPPLPGAAGE
jgi:tetratricopeptide (TPR) repeat protein